MGTVDSAAEGDRYIAVSESAQFKVLRRKSNVFIAWTAALFYGWWLAVIGLAAFVPDFFRSGVVGPINVGLLFVLVSFFLVVVVSTVSLRYARTQLDPLSDRIRAEVEGNPR